MFCILAKEVAVISAMEESRKEDEVNGTETLAERKKDEEKISTPVEQPILISSSAVKTNDTTATTSTSTLTSTERTISLFNSSGELFRLTPIFIPPSDSYLIKKSASSRLASPTKGHFKSMASVPLLPANSSSSRAHTSHAQSLLLQSTLQPLLSIQQQQHQQEQQQQQQQKQDLPQQSMQSELNISQQNIQTQAESKTKVKAKTKTKAKTKMVTKAKSKSQKTQIAEKETKKSDVYSIDEKEKHEDAKGAQAEEKKKEKEKERKENEDNNRQNSSSSISMLSGQSQSQSLTAQTSPPMALSTRKPLERRYPPTMLSFVNGNRPPPPSSSSSSYQQQQQHHRRHRVHSNTNSAFVAHTSSNPLENADSAKQASKSPKTMANIVSLAQNGIGSSAPLPLAQELSHRTSTTSKSNQSYLISQNSQSMVNDFSRTQTLTKNHTQTSRSESPLLYKHIHNTEEPHPLHFHFDQNFANASTPTLTKVESKEQEQGSGSGSRPDQRQEQGQGQGQGQDLHRPNITPASVAFLVKSHTEMHDADMVMAAADEHDMDDSNDRTPTIHLPPRPLQKKRSSTYYSIQSKSKSLRGQNSTKALQKVQESLHEIGSVADALLPNHSPSHSNQSNL
ncbi:hypothetical protein RFI_33031 [Reticulomyxa filosa]|uniref:Uncharacterized protein n=1 Tax=Reticulomyxa filosa TaxID=46433 RepID=X6LRY6_RETFI|nr:hypothetical protein RFI_33031 [Reticulomyxa filosa]|eukprot:ETO04369.1 hypothetical protein RFI_33031 [Reticulomyxa filosa]